MPTLTIAACAIGDVYVPVKLSRVGVKPAGNISFHSPLLASIKVPVFSTTILTAPVVRITSVSLSVHEANIYIIPSVSGFVFSFEAHLWLPVRVPTGTFASRLPEAVSVFG